MDLSSFTSALLERIDLVALVGERTTLKKAGGTYTGCCPFHDEKTPSFHIYNEATPPHYHCYGCGVHGDAISFIREMDHLGFMETLEKLARRAGMEVPRTPQQSEQADKRKPLYHAMQVAQDAFQTALKSHPQRNHALDYLRKRGLNEDMIAHYGLGFAPNEWQFLSREKNPQLSGNFKILKLVHARDDGGGDFDMFRNRLMFPIRDSRGRTVAFGGRTLGNDSSKYINSSETPIFHKSSELYGLWEARQLNRQLKALVVVEGYLDVIALSQFGLPKAVATLGTATNEDNLSHLLSVSADLTFCFDGDRAGLAAADKAMHNILPLYEAGQQIRFLILPDGDDPDSFIRQHGKQAFEDRLGHAAPLSQYFFDALSRDLDTEVPEQRLLLRKRANDALADLKGKPIHGVLKELAWEKTQSPRWASQPRTQEGAQGKRTFTPPKSSAPVARELPPPVVRSRTSGLIALQCLCDPAWTRHVDFLMNTSTTDHELQRLQQFLNWITPYRSMNASTLLLHLATHPDQADDLNELMRTLSVIPERSLLALESTDALKRIKSSLLENRFDQLNQQLANHPNDPDLKKQLRELLKEKTEL
jgi:DNA primase